MWGHGTGSPAIETSNILHTDDAGNVYTAGKFAGTNVDFDPSPTGTFLLSTVGSSDAFMAKYNATGQFIWAFRFGGTSRDEVYGLHVDQNNNAVYITGYFRGSNIDFDPGPGVANLTSNGDAGSDPGYGGDIFVAKYTMNGQYQWAINAGGVELYDNGLAVETDAAGNLYVGGYFTHTVDFDPSPSSATILNSATGGSIFLAKYTSAGAFQWAFNLGSPTTNNSMFDLKVDPAGNVYITGYFQGSNIDFDPSAGTAVLNSNGGYEVFVAKYNTNGQYQLAFSVGGPGNDVARGLALDNSGNIYVVGDFNNTVDFNPGIGTAFLTSNGQVDGFFAKYNASGQYQWAFNFGGTPDEYGSKVAIDGAHLFITGSFSGTADFDPSAGVENLTSAGGYDIYVGKYTLNGEYLCSFNIGGAGDDVGYSIFSSTNNTFYLTGSFTNINVDFDPSANIFNLSSAGADDIFLAKYLWPDNLLPTGTLAGDIVCIGEQAQLTFNATAGTGPFTLVLNNGTTNITQTNVQSGAPFNITPNPSFTTTYTLVSVRDALRCSESNFVSGTSAIVTVNNCTLNDFTIPDTVCVNTPVTITNTSINATTSYWNFCVANINSTPGGTNLGNIGNQFQLPVFIDYVQYNGNWYGFLTNNTPGKLTRLDFGNSLLNTPTAVNLGNIGGVINDAAEGIQVVFNEGRWYAIIVGGNGNTGGSRIIKIDFGPNLTNTTPTGTNWGNIGGLNYPGDLHMFNDNGNWYAFTVDANSSVIRFSFGSSFQNPPTAVNFGNVGGTLNYTNGIYIINDNGQWYGFVTSRNSSAITRLNFGNSLLNTPTSTGLGNPNNTLNLPRDIYVMKFCNELVGFVVNEGSNDIVKLNFASITSTPTAVSLGNIGNLAFPHSISKLFRVGPDLYTFIPNANNNTLTRINFSGCTNSSIPNYSGINPPPFSYSIPGTYNINLTTDDGLATQSSTCKQIVVIPRPNIDFTYQVNTCSPLTVQFTATGNNPLNPYWSFGDATSVSGVLNPVHTYSSGNSFIVKYSASNGRCRDTVTKTVNLSILPEDIILTRDTTICFGTTKQLLTKPALSFCWSPTTYLNNPNSPNPVTSTPQSITYYYTGEVTGNNLVVNADFSQGNTGFTSQYAYTPPNNVLAAQYYVGTNPQAWNIGMVPCTDHTSGNGNMMMVNGDEHPGTIVWSQTITVQPNTNYAFSAWIQHITTINPSSLQFSINGNPIGSIFQANNTSCIWDKFYAAWNSGNATTAVISIINQNLLAWGNDFALDDISFAPVSIKRDSVRIVVDTAIVKTNDDIIVCAGTPVQLNTTGASTYSWSPAAGLSNIGIANPIALPTASTQYTVTGTTINGCVAKDSVSITVNPKPNITKSPDTTICKNTSIQLFTSGGATYAWTPAATLSNPAIANPVASPVVNTTYYVTAAYLNSSCTNTDSVRISIHPDPAFTISAATGVCDKNSVQLTAGGGNIYSWQPSSSLNNSSIFNPIATPSVTTNYSVQITETTCNNSTTLSTTVNVNPLPSVRATKSNDLDCSNDRSQLNATGAQTYAWSPVSSLNNSTISNPVAMPAGSTMYVVKGTDALGCSNYDSVLVSYVSINASGYFMPSAFTPNNDGLNDCYGIRLWGVIQQLDFGIYNRWGERIFYTKNPDDCWDGTYKGKKQDTGVYIYMINAKTICGNTFKKGVFTLVR